MADVNDVFNEQPTPVEQEQPTSLQSTNLFIDPVTSAQFQSSLKSGDTTALASAFFRPRAEQQAEVEQRADVLRTGVEATGRAAILEGSEQARRTFQRQGKARSSAVVFGKGGLLDVSEAAKARSEATFAQGLGNIYAQVGQETATREATGADIFGQGVAAGSAREVADIQAQGNVSVANIRARTDITIAEKQKLIQDSINKTNTEIAQADRDLRRTQTIDPVTGEPYTHIEFDETLSFNTVPDDGSEWAGMPNWMVGHTIADMSREDAYNIAMDTIEQEYYKVDLSSADGWAQFVSTQDFLRDTFNITTAQEWAMFEKTIELQVRDQNITIEQFAQTLSNAKEMAWLTYDRQRDFTILALSTDLNKN